MIETNRKIAQAMHQIAALLEEQGVAFKPAAYRRAAKVIEDAEADLTTKTKSSLKELPGIGDAIADKILEYGKTGHIKALDQLLASQGGLPAELMEVEGLGPKRVRQLQAIGITTQAQLIKAAQEGKLRELERFSELIEKKILENAKHAPERSKRYPLEEAKPYVEQTLLGIRTLKGVERAEAAGSFRRGKSTVGDIDILVVAKDPAAVVERTAKLAIVSEVIAKGDTKLSFNLPNLLRVDVRFVEPAQWGSALLYFTGDKEHNISLRKKAIARGWKLNEYGLFEGDRVVASKEEEDIYKALDLPWIEPKNRTGNLLV